MRRPACIDTTGGELVQERSDGKGMSIKRQDIDPLPPATRSGAGRGHATQPREVGPTSLFQPLNCRRYQFSETARIVVDVEEGGRIGGTPPGRCRIDAGLPWWEDACSLL